MQVIPKGMESKQTDTGVAVPEEIVSKEIETQNQEEKLSPKLAQLARKELAIREREIELKAREQRVAEQENEYKTKYIPKEDISKRFSTNFSEAAQEFGLDYDQLTQAVLNQPTPETLAYSKLEREIQAMKEEKVQAARAQEEAQKQAYDRAIENIRAEAAQLVETDPEFETVQAEGDDGVSKIVAHIEKTYQETGKVLKVSEAAKVVEEQLLERALKVASLKKVQAKLMPKADELPVGQKQATPNQGPKTLTNNLNTNRKLTSRERAHLAFKGEL